MFIGHYGPAFAAKPAEPRLPLWLLFIAVQFMDVCWSLLVLSGIEKLRIVPGFTEASPLDLYYMPFSHGLIGALAISVLFGGAVTLFYSTGRVRVFLVIAAAVFSHWLLDLVVHVPDLPLWGDTMKVGFGLWRWAWISVPLELVTLAAGALIYTRMVPARRGGNGWVWAFVAAMGAVEIYNLIGPPPADTHDMAIMALVAYGVLAVLAGFVDLTRDRREPRPVNSP
jgi:hypothetical protein